MNVPMNDKRACKPGSFPLREGACCVVHSGGEVTREEKMARGTHTESYITKFTTHTKKKENEEVYEENCFSTTGAE